VLVLVQQFAKIQISLVRCWADAANALNQISFGLNTGQSATGASYSNFIGLIAGNGAKKCCSQISFGQSAGYQTCYSIKFLW
jgi:hypothetical protein